MFSENNVLDDAIPDDEADLKAKKHTLDSDEEDDKHEPKRLNIEKVCF
jgi:hypothetical protein